MLARPEATKEGGEGEAAAPKVSDAAVADYTSEVLKALFSTEISKQLSTERTWVDVGVGLQSMLERHVDVWSLMFDV